MRREREVAIYDLKGELWLERSLISDSDVRSDFETDLCTLWSSTVKQRFFVLLMKEKEIGFAFEHKPNADLGSDDQWDKLLLNGVDQTMRAKPIYKVTSPRLAK
ncbi:hypothetical protein PsAD46_01443 [Pseudovibrio sp. Ad46]|nr:hypothetical protein PsAD46_01443 [Pseudovibrio sp. Ad46]KZL01900.1 hypothetical protein PsAD5_00151 [Pseudovibrio sp. Ad5]